MSREQSSQRQQVIADLLWMKAQTLINETLMRHSVKVEKVDDHMMAEEDQKAGNFSEAEISKLSKYFNEIKSLEDIQSRAKIIIKKNSAHSKGIDQVNQLTNMQEEMFMRTVFLFHPTRAADLNDMEENKIVVGNYEGHSTCFIQSSDQIKLGFKPTQDEAISVKKCIIEIA